MIISRYFTEANNFPTIPTNKEFLPKKKMKNKLINSDLTEIEINDDQRQKNSNLKNVVDCRIINLNNIDMPSEHPMSAERKKNKHKTNFGSYGGRFPIKMTPVFGRTAYTFYNANKEFGPRVISNYNPDYNTNKSNDFCNDFAPLYVKKQ